MGLPYWMFVDVHTHLTDKAFENDVGEVIQRSGCLFLINNGYTAEDNRRTIALATRYTQVKVALGMHPSETATVTDTEIAKEKAFIAHQDVFAIGEIGLDFTYGEHEKQMKWFRAFVTLAMEKNVPMIVHSRKAEKEVIDTLEYLKAKKVVLHCFTGKLSLALRAEKLGYFFSIPPIILHSTHFQELVQRVSMTKLLTETDAPYLPPNRGERNEPRNVQLSVQKIAEIKGIDATEAQRMIFLNFQRLFTEK